MSSPGDPDILTATGPGGRLAALAPLPLRDRRDPWLRMAPMVGMVFPPAGQPGHGRTAFVRRQPARIVDGRAQGGYTGLFELICPGCGDNPYVDYSEVSPQLQWLRGPLALEAALEAYDRHLGGLLAGWRQRRKLRPGTRPLHRRTAPDRRSDPVPRITRCGLRPDHEPPGHDRLVPLLKTVQVSHPQPLPPGQSMIGTTRVLALRGGVTVREEIVYWDPPAATPVPPRATLAAAELRGIDGRAGRRW